jgi:spore germination cell wall hydrolase CwlJ-like protein
MGLGLAAVSLIGASAPQAHVRDGVRDAISETDVSFSEAALQRDIRAMAPGARVIAQRYDPLIAADSAMRDRQAEAFAARLTQADAPPPAPTVASLTLRPTLGVSEFDATSRFDPTVIDALDSARDLECLTQAVYYEARGESAQGQAAVAQVVMNRVHHPAFPKTVCGVVFQGASAGHGCQFSFACDGSMGDRREPSAWRRAETVASRALSGAVMAQVGRATHFHTTDVDAAWSQDMIRVAQVGMHVFYRFGHVSQAVIQASADGGQTSASAAPQPVLAKAASTDAQPDVAKPAADAKPAEPPVAAVQPISGPAPIRANSPTA